MVRIRVKITEHDGSSKKPKVATCISAAGALVYKIIESREAFILITDNQAMDSMLSEASRNRFSEHGLELQFPPEYEASRTVILRNVDALIHDMTEAEIIENTPARQAVKRVIKIPGNSHLLKIMFNTAELADKAVKDGIEIAFQKFAGRNVDKEIFIPIIPCYRCYAYTHQKRSCPKSEEYKVCSNCSREGHTYVNCESSEMQCINCGGAHRTLAARCPKRKAIIKGKIKERRDKSRSKTPTEEAPLRVVQSGIKLPENYLAVMAAAVTLAEKREAEVPGIFQYIMDEVLAANDVPKVKIPETVMKDYHNKGQGKEQRESRKRMRSSTDGAILERDTMEYEYDCAAAGGVEEVSAEEDHRIKILPDGTLKFSIDTDFSASTPAPTPRTTPVPTPKPTPETSPQREAAKGAVKKQQQKQTTEKKERENPRIIIIVRDDFVVPENINHNQIKKEIFKGKTMKYVYVNLKYQPLKVKEYVKTDMCALDKIRRIYLPLEYYRDIQIGRAYKIEDLVKAERK